MILRKVSARLNMSFSSSLLKIPTVIMLWPTKLWLVWTAGTGATRFGLLSLLYLVALLIGNGETVLWTNNGLEYSLASASVKYTLDLCDAGCKRCAYGSETTENERNLQECLSHLDTLAPRENRLRKPFFFLIKARCRSKEAASPRYRDSISRFSRFEIG